MVETSSIGPTDSSLPDAKRIGEFDRIYKRNTRQFQLVRTKTKKKVKVNKYAIVVIRQIDEKGVEKGVEIEIRSSRLADLLREIFHNAIGMSLLEEPPKLSDKDLFRARCGLHRRKTMESIKEEPDSELLSDIDAALSYLKRRFGDIAMETNPFVRENINYDLLWSIFSPGAEIYTFVNNLKEPEILKFYTAVYIEDRLQNKSWYEITASILNHDGESFGWGDKTLNIPKFEGTKEVCSLPAFPLDFHPDATSIRERLTKRGSVYMSLISGNPECRKYEDTAVYGRENQGDVKWEEQSFQAKGRVVLDPVTFFRLNNSRNIMRAPIIDPSYAIPADRFPIKETDLRFCNHRIQGFNFGKKRWGAFAISRLEDPAWKDDLFNQVILPDKKRKLLENLVLSRRTRAENPQFQEFHDIVGGKGKGLIGLLSGEPGLGKTVTAEAIAESSHQPLYSVAAGELGTRAIDVDRKLEEILDITERWKCVLLIDEAEVFLHQRDSISLERNALVSIFLRRLEYFEGIVILTTNRKPEIDIAFISRMHFKFHYQPLDEDGRLEIWKQFLRKFAKENKRELAQFSRKYQLNGRQIRNAAACAWDISQARNEPLTIESLREVLEDLDDDQNAALSTATISNGVGDLI